MWLREEELGHRSVSKKLRTDESFPMFKKVTFGCQVEILNNFHATYSMAWAELPTNLGGKSRTACLKLSSEHAKWIDSLNARVSKNIKVHKYEARPIQECACIQRYISYKYYILSYI